MKGDRNTINIPNYLTAEIEIGEPNSYNPGRLLIELSKVNEKDD